MSPYYCYREAQSPEELEALLRLRYAVYRNSRLAGFCPENPWALDLDAYDCRARHFGLFCCTVSGQQAVGYMRVIQQAETPAAPWIRQLAAACTPEWLEKISPAPERPFPAMNYFPGAQAVIGKLLAESPNRGEWLCEASRFVVDPAHCSARLGLRLIEASIAIYFYVLGFRNAVICCSESHVPAYRRYWFVPLREVVSKRIREVTGGSALMLSAAAFKSNKTAGAEQKNRIQALAQNYRRYGCICFHPEQPGCFAPPGAVAGAAIRPLFPALAESANSPRFAV